MKIYLDNCCYNRPYDKQDQISVILEAHAKLYLQSQIVNGVYELVTSDILYYEVYHMPNEIRKKIILDFIENNSSIHVGQKCQTEIDNKTKKIMSNGVKYKDSCHIASAIFAGCKYFLTTDKRLLKYKTNDIKILNPVDFVIEMENKEI